MEKQHFVIVEEDDGREPVFWREWVDEVGEEKGELYFFGEAWRSSSRYYRATRPRGFYSVRAVTAEEVVRLQGEQLRRMAACDPAYLGYRYYALLDRRPLDNPNGLVRLWTTRYSGMGEQRFLIGQGWRDSWMYREDWQRDRVDGDFVLISPDMAKQIIERWSAPQE